MARGQGGEDAGGGVQDSVTSAWSELENINIYKYNTFGRKHFNKCALNCPLMRRKPREKKKY